MVEVCLSSSVAPANKQNAARCFNPHLTNASSVSLHCNMARYILVNSTGKTGNCVFQPYFFLDRTCHLFLLWLDKCWCHKGCVTALCVSVHEDHLTCCTASDLIPEICNPTTAADGSVSRLKSQQLTLHQPKLTYFR